MLTVDEFGTHLHHHAVQESCASEKDPDFKHRRPGKSTGTTVHSDDFAILNIGAENFPEKYIRNSIHNLRLWQRITNFVQFHVDVWSHMCQVCERIRKVLHRDHSRNRPDIFVQISLVAYFFKSTETAEVQVWVLGWIHRFKRSDSHRNRSAKREII